MKMAPPKKAHERKRATKKQKSDTHLIVALQDYFRKLGKSNVQGFHLIDTDGDWRVSAKEIKETLAAAGHVISIGRGAKAGIDSRP
mmetsp:Transcript_21166/g.31340  ORF Transcript_21166/g.31340 Transcript_21166/m.31340 type:complete len:86 (+) Transcript_21166:107-364(+)